MVLSLPFILAIVGASVALLVGILIFGEVSEAIECPATGVFIPGSGAGGYDNLGTLGSLGDATYFESGLQTDFVSVPGIINEGVYQNGTSTLGVQGEIRLGATPSTWNFLHAVTGNNITSINLWINGDVQGAPAYPILDTLTTDSSSNVGWGIYTLGSNFRIRVIESSSYQVNSGSFSPLAPEPPDDTNWHMITIIMDKGNQTGAGSDDWIKYCLDADCSYNEDSFQPFTGAINTPQYNLTIGSAHCGACTENEFDVDDLTIWQGYQLTQSNVNTMYNGGSGSTGRSIATGSQVVHHSFDLVDAFGGSPGSFVGGGTGNTECEQAKDTAWTVIGILPVALFFGLFALFSSIMPKPT